MSVAARVLAISGGIGGAKLALGLQRVLEPGELAVLVNTGDDFRHLGLAICPDLDTVTYTLAGVSNTETGWGRRGETWHFLDELARLDIGQDRVFFRTGEEVSNPVDNGMPVPAEFFGGHHSQCRIAFAAGQGNSARQ